MLVLTRKCLEVIVVGGTDGVDPMVKITVLGIENGRVRLGFEAAAEVPVHRLEVWERMHASRKVGVAPDAVTARAPPISHDPWS